MKGGTIMDFERIAMIMKFARLKRGLLQEDVAKRLRISTSYVTAIENCHRKSIDTTRIILHVLGVNPAVIDDSGLFECIEIESLRKIPGFKAICSTIDMHCYSISPEIAQKITGRSSDYIESKDFAEIIFKLGPERLKKIFKEPVNLILPDLIVFPEEVLKSINSKVLESCVVVDPFFLLLKELGIEVVNYYELLDSIEKKLKGIRFLPLSIIEKQKEEFKKIVESMDKCQISC